jgi:hypothetical protein
MGRVWAGGVTKNRLRKQGMGMGAWHEQGMGRERAGHGQSMGRAWAGHGQGMGRARAGHGQGKDRA